jgi:hypothetical protein
LGSFGELYVLWKGILKIGELTSDQTLFNKLLDLFPEFLRYGILTILEFIYYKKKEGSCGKVFIYTNNQCPPPWVSLIANYIESKNMPGLFERPICAFKIKNITFEPERTTHEKTLRDFIKCSRLPKNAELCFIDNSYFPKMNAGSIFYIQPRSYFHSLTLNEIINRFAKSAILESQLSQAEWIERLIKWFSTYDDHNIASQKNKDIDIAVSRKLMYTIKEFFYFVIKKGKTKRRRLSVTHSRTIRNRNSNIHREPRKNITVFKKESL